MYKKSIKIKQIKVLFKYFSSAKELGSPRTLCYILLYTIAESNMKGM